MDNPVTGSKIEKVTLIPRYTLKDGTKTEITGDAQEVDLTPFIAEIYYYETLLSPNTTAVMSILNQFKNIKLQENIYIAGGEEVTFTCKDFVSENNRDKDSGLRKIKMRVEIADNKTTTNTAEVFRLRLESSWKETAENVNKIQGEQKGPVTEIANAVFKANFDRDIEFKDNATNTMNVTFGDEKKDDTFPAIMGLAAKAAYNESAGFFFYQTKFGHHFKSVDRLIQEAKSGDMSAIGREPYSYQYSGVNPGIENADVSSRTIISISKKTNNWFVKNQMRADASRPVTPIVMDPLTYNWASPGPVTYESKFETFDIGEVDVSDAGDFGKAAWGSTKLENFGMMYRLPDDICEFQNDPLKAQAVSRARYTSLFGEMITISIPCNTSLIAGSSVKLDIKKNQEGSECSFEDNLVNSGDAGLYIVAAVCHAFDRKAAYSSVLLVRDQKRKEAKT